MTIIAPLVPRAAGVGAYGAIDAAGLRETLRQAAEERHHRRGGDLRRGHQTMRFVPTKTVEQQSCLMLHRVRHLFIRQQTAVINSIRAYLAEFGIVAPVGRRGVEQLHLAMLRRSYDPPRCRSSLSRPSATSLASTQRAFSSSR
jgi:hypothetical protein